MPPDPSLPRSRAPVRVPGPAPVLTLLAGIALLFVPGSIALVLVAGEAGILLAQLLLLLVPVLILLRLGRFDPVASLGLSRPPVHALPAALALALGGLPVAWGIAWVQSRFLPLPEGWMEAMERMLSDPGALRAAWLFLLIAVVPAVVEEILFRGLLLRALRNFGGWVAVGASAFIFGIFHITTESVFRFLPTFWLGLLIGAAVWRTGSLWIGMAMHFANNGLLLLLAILPVARELGRDPSVPPPVPALVGAILLLGWGGARILRMGPGAAVSSVARSAASPAASSAASAASPAAPSADPR